MFQKEAKQDAQMISMLAARYETWLGHRSAWNGLSGLERKKVSSDRGAATRGGG